MLCSLLITFRSILCFSNIQQSSIHSSISICNFLLTLPPPMTQTHTDTHTVFSSEAEPSQTTCCYRCYSPDRQGYCILSSVSNLGAIGTSFPSFCLSLLYSLGLPLNMISAYCFGSSSVARLISPS